MCVDLYTFGGGRSCNNVGGDIARATTPFNKWRKRVRPLAAQWTQPGEHENADC